MGVIRKLPADLVNQIAAGEVIERPASALKELVENALDAGATRIEVALEDGGRRVIRVVDDGRGIAADDLPLAVASHATSKIATLDDLFRIRSLGFRGEALASVGSIAELRVASRTAAGDGHEIEVRGGATGEVRPAGVARGTTVEVRNLFFNTPARRKFLREGAGELKLCVDALTRIALARPDVAFRLEHERRLSFECAAVDAARASSPPEVAAGAPSLSLARIADLYGRELAADLVPVSGARGAVRLGGFVALPRRTRGDSTQQLVSLGGRTIRDRLVASAIREAYHGFLMTRRHPIVFLELAAEPEAVDVNVHPQKLEVRFRESRDVFALVVRAIRAALEEARIDPVLEAAPSREPTVPERIFARPPHDAAARTARDLFAASAIAEPAPEWRIVSGRSLDGSAAAPESADRLHELVRPVPSFVPVPAPEAVRSPQQPPPPRDLAAPPAPPRHLQLASGYLVVETAAGFEVIDPHALHERILYEELRARIAGGAVEVQALLVPEVVELSAVEEARLEHAREALAAIGLVAEPFGPRTAAIQAVPAILRRVKRWAPLLRDLLAADEDEGAGPSRARVLDHLTATMACKAAVKLGEPLAPGEVEALLERRAAAERSHLCPHGRPTALAFPASELERQFKR